VVCVSILPVFSTYAKRGRTAAILRNFIGGLKAASLTPKRFLLQTGAKHYGFHIGPATSPSFESDPRITLENNFYYPQEDLLSTYCKENGLEWNVMRPSYIIGAVRDNLLNNMIGISIYGAVCAYLKEPLKFPVTMRVGIASTARARRC
jgi:hypothetical protein